MGKVNTGSGNQSQQMVLTPGGLRPENNVHLIEQGYHLSGIDNSFKKIHTATNIVVKDFGNFRANDLYSREKLRTVSLKEDLIQPLKLEGKPVSDQWIVYSGWSNNSDQPITYFSTSWIVPPPPETNNNQLIYIFNGIENSDLNIILQPVLQWGVSPAGGGDYWAIANWYVGEPGSGIAAHGSLIPVKPGDSLKGIMTLFGRSENSFNYLSSFDGHNADLAVTDIEELTWANEVLECYGFAEFTDYPSADRTTMSAIEIRLGDDEAPISWTSFNAVTDNGQHCEITQNGSPAGEVILYYKNPLNSINPLS